MLYQVRDQISLAYIMVYGVGNVVLQFRLAFEPVFLFNLPNQKSS